jgi:peptide/nickel transport system ATP-binding protein
MTVPAWRRRIGWRFRFARRADARLGLVVGAAIVLIALLGPVFAPHDPTQSIALPFQGSRSGLPLGADFVGRDVLSRILYGGRTLILLALGAMFVVYAISLPLGLFAGYSRSRLDGFIMRGVDVFLVIPPIIFLLIVTTATGPSTAVMVVAVGVVLSPSAIRVIRTATLETSVTGYVEAALARGDRTLAVLRREILPNISGIVLADAGLRLTYAILAIASLNFLGLGLQPPAADWGLMISENRSGLQANPLAIAVPAALIAVLTISVNLVADAFARSLGSSAQELTAVESGLRRVEASDTEALHLGDETDGNRDGPAMRPGLPNGIAPLELEEMEADELRDAVVVVKGLTLALDSGWPIVEGVSFAVRPGEILGVVGESGSGKTSTAVALLGYARPGVRIIGGSVAIDGQQLLGRPESEVRRLRGKLVSYVPQEPTAALNPSLRIGKLIDDLLRQHQPPKSDTKAGRMELIREALDRIDLPSSRQFLRRFPHQLSGGQQQRVAIAKAVICTPRLIVLDEPTTGLDVVTQVRVLDEIKRLRSTMNVAMVYVSHDLAVVAALADRIAVMYAGRIVEEGCTQDVLARPAHPYTAGLVKAIPDVFRPTRLVGIPGAHAGVQDRLAGCAFAPRCHQRVERCTQELPCLERVARARRVRCFEWQRTPPPSEQELKIAATLANIDAPVLSVEGLGAIYRSRSEVVVAASDVSFQIGPGESVALVGESGSGKSTIARCIAGLHEPSSGRIFFDGHPLAPRAKDRSREDRRRCQIIFQSPRDALNPRRTVRDAISWPMRELRDFGAAQADDETLQLLDRVHLPRRLADRFPLELSGGERQRVAIARALGAQPQLIICDEITSALDVSIQAAVLDLLAELRAELQLSLLFISHDLGVVASVADRVLVLEHGVICDQGSMQSLVESSSHPYTRNLITAISDSRASPDRAELAPIGGEHH